MADPQDRVDEHPAADVTLETNESIVVAIPGHAAEEFALNAVPDNAIQIIDDEPQGVPTEEEVDAMLGATAAALLTSGLSGEVVADYDERPPAAMESHGPEEKEGEEEDEHEGETEIVLPGRTAAFAVPVSNLVADVEPAIAGPAWELSPPPEAAAEQVLLEDVEVIAEAPVGMSLFSEEAVLAAAPPSWAPAEPFSTLEAPVVEQAALADVTGIVEFTPVVEQAPIAEVVEFTPVIEPPQSVESAAPVVAERAPVVEHEQVAEVASVVEFTPAAEVPAVDYPSVVEPTPIPEYTPFVEVLPVVGYTPAVEPEHVEPASAVAEFTAAVEHAPIAEVAPLVEPTAVVEPPPAAAAHVTELTQVVETPSFDEPPVYPSIAEPVAAAFVVPEPVGPESAVEDVQAMTAFAFVPAPAAEALVGAVAEPAVEAAAARQETEDRSVNAGAEPVMSEPTPQAWTPSVPERPMEVTPQLRRQEEAGCRGYALGGCLSSGARAGNARAGAAR